MIQSNSHGYGKFSSSRNAYVFCHSVLQTKTTVVKGELLSSIKTVKSAELLSFLVLIKGWKWILACSFLHVYADHCCQITGIFVQHVAFGTFKSQPSYLQVFIFS